MGKATKWLHAVLGLKKSDGINPPLSSPVHHHSTSRSKEKRRWSFVKSYREKDQFPQHNHYAHSLLHQSQRSVVSHGTDKAVPSSTDGCGGGGLQSSSVEGDPNKHAIAVATATAAVAEAAVAAAQAAAEVVRLTSSGRSGNSNNNLTAVYVSGSSNSGAWRDDVDLLSAAVKIQSAFRGYLARRALRALKSLVRLQALVRGHIERKRTAEWLHRMQALFRAQARARSVRVQMSESSHSSCKSSHFHQAGPPTPEKFEHSTRARSGKYEQSHKLKRTGSKSSNRALGGDNEVAHLSFNRSERRTEERAWDHWKHSTTTGTIEDENIDKILEIDPGKPHFTLKRRNLFHSSHLAVGGSDQYSHSFTTSKDSTTHQTVQSPSSVGEVQSLSPLKFRHELEETYCTAANTPQLYSAASSKGGSGKISPFTPTKSDGSISFLSGYSDHPNYMSTTESSKAKVRSLSAPRQRPQYERSSSTKRYSILGFGGEARLSTVQQASALRSSFTSKAYPGSGRLDRLGMPVGQMH